MLYKNRFELESLFRYFDANGDGYINLVEFRDGVLSLGSLVKVPLSEEQVFFCLFVSIFVHSTYSFVLSFCQNSG